MRWILLLMILLAGCNTTRQASSTVDVSESVAGRLDIDYTAQLERQLEEYRQRLERQSERKVEVVFTVEYDTDKPVEETTGRPPVKSETESRTYTGIDLEVQENVQAKEVETSAVDIQANAELDIKVMASVRMQEKKKVRASKIIPLFGVLMIAAAAVWWMKRKRII